MSLIERAVARLTQTERPDTHAAGDAPQGAVNGTERKTTIEALADRLAAEAASAVAAPAPAVPATPAARPAESESESRGVPVRSAPNAPAAAAHGPEPLRIHLESLRARGLVVPSGTPTPTANEFRIIKRPLLANAFGRGPQQAVRNGRRIMITSAFPGEGKSFCAINLAMSIAAERDHGVILVDADVARPSIPRELGVEVEVGLMDWLIDGKPDLSQLVRKTNVDTLSICPRAAPRAGHQAAGRGEAMGGFSAAEASAGQHSVFDSPPLLVTTEARVLASYMERIVMVVEAGKTPREAVTQALAAIESNEVIGLVLNKAEKIETSGYYQGYGYGSA